MKDKIKYWWDWIQSLFDIDGDFWMSLWTGAMIWRIVAVLFGHPPVTLAEATAYSTAVSAFAYSNKKEITHDDTH